MCRAVAAPGGTKKSHLGSCGKIALTYIPRFERAIELLSDQVHAYVRVRCHVGPGLGPAASTLPTDRWGCGPRKASVDPWADIFYFFSLDSTIGNGFTPCTIAPLSLELPFETNEVPKMTKSWRVAPMSKKLPYML
jgi:hypothetical protein